MRLRPFFPLILMCLVTMACDEEAATDVNTEFELRAPEGLTAVRAGQKAVRLTWMDTSSNEEGFEVERKTNAGIFAGRMYTARDLAVAVDSMNLEIDSTYAYRVRAVRYEQRGPYSTEAVITLTP